MWDQSISFPNYTAGAVAFLILFLQLLSSRLRGIYPLSLAAAALVTSARMVILTTNLPLQVSAQVLFTCDVLFYAFWYLAIFGGVFRLTGARLPRWMSVACISLTITISALAVANFTLKKPLTTIYASELVAWSNLLFAIFGLVLLEQLYRNVSFLSRHAIKFFVLGIGGLFAYEMYLFSQILVFQSIPAASWNARGAIYGIAGVFLVITLSKPDEAQRISLSRHLVFYSTSLFAAGLLLSFMSAVGYYVKHFGEGWGAALQQVITFTAILGTIIVSTVPRLRAWTRVFLDKHFFSHKYDYRHEWLKLIK